MKNKASLALMELLVMVLVLALAAAASLRCFVWAARTAEETAVRDRAVTLAQNTAEAVKSCGGNFPAAEALLEVPEGLTLEINEIPSETAGLGQAEIRVENSGGEPIFSLCIAWQEEP